MESDRRADAIQAIVRAAIQFPKDFWVQYVAGVIHLQSGKAVDAEVYFSRALKLDPTFLTAKSGLGASLVAQKKYKEGLVIANEICKDDPNAMDAFDLAMNCHVHLGDYESAVIAGQRAHELAPTNEQVTQNFYATLRDFDPKRGAEFLQKILAGSPSRLLLRSLAPDTLYPDDLPESEIAKIHNEVAELQKGLAIGYRPSVKQPSGKLRLGFLSADFRAHSVSFFLLPLLKKIDQSKFSLFGYSLNVHVDSFTKQYRSLMTFRPHTVSSTGALYDLIIGDEIDVLIDLAGLTGGGRPDVITTRPAPVIISMIGYASSVGSPCIDYRIVDSITDPSDSEDWGPEQRYRMDPCFLTYDPIYPLPNIVRRPSGSRLTFGSLNNDVKITSTTVRHWSAVLQAFPESELLLKSLRSGAPVVQNRLKAEFDKYGLGDRIRFLPYAKSPDAHIQTYNQIDIALDTFPYNGTTTTMESLMMGVPVASVSGTVHRSRVTRSLLAAIGHPEWAVDTSEELVEVVRKMVDDLEGLRASRQSLRKQVQDSVICDHAGYARRFEAMIEDIVSKRWTQ